jgi:rhodanese-related sulfurtransferase
MEEIMNMTKLNIKKTIIGALLTFLLLSTFALIQPTLASPQSNPQNVSAQQAKRMIKQDSNVILLDVRNESEYNLGHLDKAVWIPLYQLESRISELTEYQDHKIIVYCAAGSRSASASQILADHGFTKVYNMVGGINAWMQADYPIVTSYHYVSVDTTIPNKHAQIDIEPFLLYKIGCAACNQGCNTSNPPNVSNSSITVLDENATHSKFLVSYTQNGVSVQLTVEKNLLWQYSQCRNGVNRTVTFVSTTITDGDTIRQIYGLVDFVKTPQYNMTLVTGLDPLDSSTYNASITTMSYVPLGKNETLSAEKIVFNSTVTLSEQYSCLSQVSKKLSNEYNKSPDSALNVFGARYSTIASEFALLSRMVKTNLSSYDNEILRSTAVIADDAVSCLACQIGLTALIGGGCIVICILTVGIACAICLSYGWAIRIIGSVGVGAFCTSQGYCP